MPKNTSIVMIDCQIAGVSGDMFLGAFIDLGANTKKIVDAIRSLEDTESGYKNIKIEIGKTERGGFSATKIDVTADPRHGMKGQDLIKIVNSTLSRLKLSAKAEKFASAAIKSIVNSEAGIHSSDLKEVHVHEMGEIDTVAEIIGCAVAMEDLGLYNSKIYSSPASVGGGLIKFSHGTATSPAPATLAIFKSGNFPIKGGPIESELSTPTGAAILTNLANEIGFFYPAMKPIKVGYGAGNKNFKEIPNILRITIGEGVDNGFLRDEITVLETNLDDVSGEVVGYAMERLMGAGAKDVSIIPVFTKKNRPGQILKVIADKKDEQLLAKIIFDETGTFGTRVSSCQRLILSREIVKVKISLDSGTEQIRVKIGRDKNEAIVRIKPEYEDLKKIARKTGRPLSELSEEVTGKARKILQGRETQ